MTQTTRERLLELRTLMASFTVRPIDPADPATAYLYFPFHSAEGRPRGRDPIADLRGTLILSPNNGTCQLFSGFQGTGKSTELRRLRGDLQRDGFQVLFVEGSRYINLYQPLEATDLLLSIAIAVGEAMQARIGQDPRARTLYERLAEFFGNIRLAGLDVGLSAEVDAKAAKASVDIAKLRLELAQNPSFKTRVQDALRGSFSAFLDAFRRFMAAARDLLGLEPNAPAPVLIIDDLEKVQGVGRQQELVQRQIEDIFSAFHYALKIPGWHTIWASPPYLPFLNAAIANTYDHYAVLPMVRLWDAGDPQRRRSTTGFDAMRRFLHLRGNIDALFSDPRQMDDLIWVSSGHIRDLFRLMQDVLREIVSHDGHTPVTADEVRQIVEDYVATSQRAVYTEDHDFLRRVGEVRRVEASTALDVGRIAKLVDTQLVMLYRNGAEWFDLSVPVQRLLAPHGSSPE